MKTKFFLGLSAFAFAIVTAIASNSNPVVTYYGYNNANPAVCVAGTNPEPTCGAISGTQCTVTIGGTSGHPAYKDTACQDIAYKP